MKKLLIGTIGIGIGFYVFKVGSDIVKAASQEFVERIRNEAVEKTVDDFVKAVVFNRRVTIESKHNGSATVTLVK